MAKSHRGIYRLLFITTGTVLVAVVGVLCFVYPAYFKRSPRVLDAAPMARTLVPALPQGRVEAGFQMATGQDQMTTKGKEAGLVVVVRQGAQELRQTIASCRHPAMGSALGGGTDEVLAIAICNDEFWLMPKSGAIEVHAIEAGLSKGIVARFSLPTGSSKPTDLSVR